MLKSNKRITFYIMIFSVAVLVIISVVYILTNPKSNDNYSTTVAILSSIMAILSIVSSLIVYLSNPRTVIISLLGYPSSGKTVYITMLFYLLLEEQKVQGFSAYGDDTIERVAKDFRTLKGGEWLPPTPFEGITYYYANQKSGMRKSKIQIGDFAGEHFQNELKSNNYFFQKTSYYNFIKNSDVVFLSVDSQRALVDHEYVLNIETSFISILQILNSSQKILSKSKIQFPVALLFLKSDTITDIHNGEDSLRTLFHRTISFCEKNCHSFEKFFVSAVSRNSWSEKEKRPPEVFLPKDVVEPLTWSLKRI